MRKRYLSLFLCLAMLILMAAPALADGYAPGTYTAEAQGFGGTVTVTIETDENGIVSVSAEGADETPDVGGQALPKLAEAIEAADSADIEGISGATFTSDAVKLAAADALAQAVVDGSEAPAEEEPAEEEPAEEEPVQEEPAEEEPAQEEPAEEEPAEEEPVQEEPVEEEPVEEEPVEEEPEEEEPEETADGRMEPGVYTGEAWGFNKVEKIRASVKVTEDEIQKIDVDMDNMYESSVKLQIAEKLMVPRILESQSLSVDTITGATGSSAGIRGAVADAVKQALAAGGSDPGAIKTFQKKIEPEAKEETLDYDVVVVGMGGSGSYAALRIAQEMRLKDPKSNASVLAIDKAGNYGGTTVFTSEAMVINPKTFQEERNNGEDYVDAEALYEDWIEYTTSSDGQQMAKPEMIRLMIDRSGDAMDWLRHNGFDFNTPAGGLSGGTGAEAKEFLVKYRFAPTQTNNRINKDTFQKCFDHLYTKFKAYGGQYLLETEGTGLIYDEETNRVTGVTAYNPVTNTSYTINAKAVVLATGGFAGSAEMSEKYLGDEYYPLKGKWNICGSWQNDGKMIQAAIDIGAGTFNIGMTPVCHLFGPDGFLNSYPNVPVPGEFTTKTNLPAVWSEGDLPTMLCFWEKVFGVNSRGQRYLPEDKLATFDAWKGGPNVSVIVTEKQIRDIAENGIDVDDTVQHIKSNFDNLLFKVPIPRGTVLPNALQVMEDGVKAGFISKGDTIEELAGELGLDPATLKAELDKYNEACRTGEDPLGKPAEFLEPMEEGPYYAIHAGMHCYGTCAGVDINESFQVLQADGETAIGGLYAVGADGEGVIYSPEKAYVTYGGADNGWALLSGYICGGKVVENLE